MSESQYLWEKQGEPEEDVARLERVLARHRYVPEPLRAEPRRARGVLIGAAAVIVIALGAYVWMRQRGPENGPYVVEGLARVARVGNGERLVTSTGENARVAIATIGHVDVAPDTSLVVEEIGALGHHLRLERGHIAARILAPSRVFQIDTPSGRSVDLGCAYELTVLSDGASEMRVTSGQVAFEFDGRELYVPSGASVRSQPKIGPGAPIFDDASAEFRDVLVTIERGIKLNPTLSGRALVDRARPKDSLTLWHIAVDPNADPIVAQTCLDGLLRQFPLPSGATIEGIASGDPAMRRAWMETIKPAWCGGA